MLSDALNQPALILNKSWRPIDTQPVHKVLGNIFKENAHILGPDYQKFNIWEWIGLGIIDGQPSIGTSIGPMRVPKIVIVDRVAKYSQRKTKFCRGNLWKRDNYYCQYCAKRPADDELTMDHIIPKHMWDDEWTVRGKRMPFRMTSFENCVLACIKCNKHKDYRTLDESGMRLVKVSSDKDGKVTKTYYDKPVVPPWNPAYSISRKNYPVEWSEWISDLYWNTELES